MRAIRSSFLRNILWVAAGAFAVGLVIFGWILVSAGYLGLRNEQKLGPERSLAPTSQDSAPKRM